MDIERIIEILLGEKPRGETLVAEVSLHRSPRSKIWIACFTGAIPGQRIWRSTKTSDQSLALSLGKQWEAEARAERAAFGYRFKKPTVRVRHREHRGPGEPMTQREVALLLGMSERGVREVERRAFEKLRNHPLLREIWRQYSTGEVDEDDVRLTPAEIAALWGLAQNPSERQLIQKILRLIQMVE